MKEYAPQAVRNVALVSHSNAGKTMLTEALLHFSGATSRLGKVESGTTVSDFDEEEVRRGISIYTSVIPIEYRDVKINLLDTPGYSDFVGEVISALRVADSGVVLVDAVAGVEVGTELAWEYLNRFNLPRILLINKMDRENASFEKALAAFSELSDIRPIPVQLPWGEEEDFQGVINLIDMKAYKGDGKTTQEIPAELRAQAEEARVRLVEAAAEGEDALLEKYLSEGELSQEEIVRGLHGIVRTRSYVPVFVAAGGSEMGLQPLLDALVDLLPAANEMPPAVAQGKRDSEELAPDDKGPLAAYVWRTTADPFVGKMTYFRVYSGTMNSDSRVWNANKGSEERLGTLGVPRGKDSLPVKTVHSGDIGVVTKLGVTTTGDTLCEQNHELTMPVPEYPRPLYRVAIMPKTQADSAKISPTLTRICEEDMTLSWHMEAATNQTILEGMGDIHIDVALRRAESKFQVGLIASEPRVPYLETITKNASAMYRHKKQTGGAGQFGEVHLRVEPVQDKEFDFAWEVFGGAISSSYAPSIQKGVQSAMKEGILAGYPINGVRVAVFDGKEHPVDSKPIAFEIAGREAFKLAFKEAGPVLMEPITRVQITVPESAMGDVLGDLNTRRARVLGMESEHGFSVINALVPMSEMLRYTTVLRSLTAGRGIFGMEFDHYEVVPPHVAQEIINERQKEPAGQKEG